MPTKRILPFREGLFGFSAAQLLVALIALFVLAPFVDRLKYGALAEAILFTVMMLAAVNAIGGQRRTLFIAALLMLPAFFTRWTNHLHPGAFAEGANHVFSIIFVGFVIWQLFRFVMSASVVSSEVICAALSIYLLYAVAWAFIYTIVGTADPKAFTWTISTDDLRVMAGFTALYFSVEILTALAFGDILPVSNVARMMTVFEATTGIFYVTILIARLVGLYTSKSSSST